MDTLQSASLTWNSKVRQSVSKFTLGLLVDCMHSSSRVVHDLTSVHFEWSPISARETTRRIFCIERLTKRPRVYIYLPRLRHSQEIVVGEWRDCRGRLRVGDQLMILWSAVRRSGMETTVRLDKFITT